MTIEEGIIFGKKYLSSVDAKILLSMVTGYDTLELINYLNKELSTVEEDKFKKMIDARKNNKPLQYITNSVNFYGIELYVDENVLIPRFETEELVENSIKIINERFTNPKVLDLCCGSGAIGISIKTKIPTSIVTISDISSDALKVANINKNKYNLDIKVINSDLFDKINEKYDCIISNPPYIRNNEEIEEIVKNNEPSIALYGGENGLLYYERILKDIKKYLNEKFLIAFEIGQDQSESIKKIANFYLNNIEIIVKKDLQERDRMLFILSK
ncbi:MAG: peptide chain release factor N(5)-glutamine methyltransferase [Bacilli bacterium]|nr:peptide chain release factor N(5)-glutamine methyltransferase [Bacilli bacterium]